MAEKAILIDTSKCIACKGCQIACKQWNGLPAENHYAIRPEQSQLENVASQIQFPGKIPGNLIVRAKMIVEEKRVITLTVNEFPQPGIEPVNRLAKHVGVHPPDPVNQINFLPRKILNPLQITSKWIPPP